jgi:hypothetical protein
MIYGLFRADALRKAGIFPSVLLPDVLLLSELSLHGSYKQVNKPLWFRRYVGLFDIQRQKKNLFTKVPWYAHIPWPIVNATLLFFNTVFKSHKNDLKTRILGLNLTIRFFIRYLPTIKRDSKLIGKYVEKLIKIDWIRKRYLTILGHDDSDLFRDRKP